MSLSHLIVLSIKAGSFFTLDQAKDHLPTDLIAYQRLIGKLIYLACETRPDIAFVVGQLSRHNSDPRIDHICIAKQTLRYLKGTSTLSIVLGINPAKHQDEESKYESCRAVGYVNSSYVGDIDNQKSITRHCFLFRGVIITWYNKRQQTVLILMFETNYMAISHKTKEEVWIRRFLNELLLE